MLAASEAFCREAGVPELTLHARLADEAALALYAGSGYEVMGRDGSMMALQRIRPRALMRKLL